MKKEPRIRFTNEQKWFLQDNFYSMTHDQLAAHFNIPVEKIKRKCQNLKLLHIPRWPVEDVLFVQKNFAHMPMDEMISKINRTEKSIRKVANKLNVKRHVPRQPPQTKRKKAVKPVPKEEKPKRRRWHDNKMTTKAFDPTGQKTVRIDHRTVVYVPENADAKQIEAIVKRYQKTA